MLLEEKKQLLAFFEYPRSWCPESEAQNADGEWVRFDDVRAVAWGLTGALRRLFGVARASVLSEQIDQHLHGKHTFGHFPRRENSEAIAALLDFNDQPDLTFEGLCEQLRSMPIWHGGRTDGV